MHIFILDAENISYWLNNTKSDLIPFLKTVRYRKYLPKVIIVPISCHKIILILYVYCSKANDILQFILNNMIK